MSQFSYYLLTIPYNSMFSVLLLNTLKYHRSPFGKTIWKSIDVLKKIYLGHKRRFQSECSDDVLKYTSRGMKCLMTHKETYFTSGCHPKMNIWVFREYPIGTSSHSRRSWNKRFCDISRYLCLTQRFWYLDVLIMLTLLLPLHMCIDIRKMFSTCWDRT